MTKRLDTQAREVVDAIRLAIEGGDSDKTRVAVIRTILADGPAVNGNDTSSVKRLIKAVRSTRRGRFIVAP